MNVNRKQQHSPLFTAPEVSNTVTEWTSVDLDNWTETIATTTVNDSVSKSGGETASIPQGGIYETKSQSEDCTGLNNTESDKRDTDPVEVKDTVERCADSNTGINGFVQDISEDGEKIIDVKDIEECKDITINYVETRTGDIANLRESVVVSETSFDVHIDKNTIESESKEARDNNSEAIVKCKLDKSKTLHLKVPTENTYRSLSDQISTGKDLGIISNESNAEASETVDKEQSGKSVDKDDKEVGNQHLQDNIEYTITVGKAPSPILIVDDPFSAVSMKESITNSSTVQASENLEKDSFINDKEVTTSEHTLSELKSQNEQVSLEIKLDSPKSKQEVSSEVLLSSQKSGNPDSLEIKPDSPKSKQEVPLEVPLGSPKTDNKGVSLEINQESPKSSLASPVQRDQSTGSHYSSSNSGSFDLDFAELDAEEETEKKCVEKVENLPQDSLQVTSSVSQDNREDTLLDHKSTDRIREYSEVIENKPKKKMTTMERRKPLGEKKCSIKIIEPEPWAKSNGSGYHPELGTTKIQIQEDGFYDDNSDPGEIQWSRVRTRFWGHKLFHQYGNTLTVAREEIPSPKHMNDAVKSAIKSNLEKSNCYEVTGPPAETRSGSISPITVVSRRHKPPVSEEFEPVQPPLEPVISLMDSKYRRENHAVVVPHEMRVKKIIRKFEGERKPRKVSRSRVMRQVEAFNQQTKSKAAKNSFSSKGYGANRRKNSYEAKNSSKKIVNSASTQSYRSVKTMQAVHLNSSSPRSSSPKSIGLKTVIQNSCSPRSSQQFSPKSFGPRSGSPKLAAPSPKFSSPKSVQSFDPKSVSPRSCSPRSYSSNLVATKSVSPNSFSPKSAQSFGTKSVSPRSCSPNLVGIKSVSPKSFSPKSPQSFGTKSASPRSCSPNSTISAASVISRTNSNFQTSLSNSTSAKKTLGEIGRQKPAELYQEGNGNNTETSTTNKFNTFPASKSMPEGFSEQTTIVKSNTFEPYVPSQRKANVLHHIWFPQLATWLHNTHPHSVDKVEIDGIVGLKQYSSYLGKAKVLMLSHC